MHKKILAALLLLALPQILCADSHWLLERSTLTYHVSHPLHEAEGVSHAARGKGVCHAGECDFLIAVPVKTFNSGNSNRDLHMLEVVRGAQFPLVVVRLHVPAAAVGSAALKVDLQIQFAGQTAHYSRVAFQRVARGNEVEVKGTIPLKLSDFKIKPPELLDIPIKNEVPVRVDTFWRLE
ncbi:MAG: YceI family protein [Terriglobia bacterium]